MSKKQKADEAPLLNAQRSEEDLKRLQEARQANTDRNNERLERLNAIANSADENKDDLEDIDEPTDWEEETPAEELQAEESAEPEDVRVTNGENYYRIIVNGVEKWLSLQQLRDTSSKVTAADEYLRNAKEAVKNITAQAPSKDEPAIPAKGRVREVLTRALMGEQDAIDELALHLDGTLSREDVLKAVDGRVDGRLTFREAVDWFETEYGDVLKIDAVRQRAVSVDAEMAQQDPNMDFKARLKQVGDDARQYHQQLRRQFGADDTGRSQKEARKASVRSIPVAGQRQAGEEDEDDGESYESAIGKIASARGQGRPIIHRRT